MCTFVVQDCDDAVDFKLTFYFRDNDMLTEMSINVGHWFVSHHCFWLFHTLMVNSSRILNMATRRALCVRTCHMSALCYDVMAC